MTAERWRQVERIYVEAAAKPASLRDAYVEQACGGDREFRAEVERMLSGEIAAGSSRSSNAISFESAQRPVARPQCNAGSASDGRRS